MENTADSVCATLPLLIRNEFLFTIRIDKQLLWSVASMSSIEDEPL